MSKGGNGQSVPFEVIMSDHTKSGVKALHKQAFQRGKGQQFLLSLRQIIERLHSDPRVFGEALYRLPSLQLTVCQAAISPVVVNYAVHDERPLVFIKGFKVFWL
jgi:hypothetical protein